MDTCEVCGKQFENNFGEANLGAGNRAFKCPECTTHELVTSSNSREDREYEAQKRAEALSRVITSRPLVTIIIIVICALVFGVELYAGANFSNMPISVALRLGADFGPLTLGGQWWRMFTAMFLHFGIIHLALNMWCLWSLGSLTERLMGRASFLLLYILTGLGGSLLSLAVHPEVVSAGASGAVFGVAGGLITYLHFKKTPLNSQIVKSQLKSLLIFLGINLAYSLRPGVDLMGHAGGLITGLILGALLPAYLTGFQAGNSSLQKERQFSANNRLLFIAIGSLFVLSLCAIGVRRAHADEIFLQNSLDKSDRGQAAQLLPRLQEMVRKSPNSTDAHYALGYALLKSNRAGEAVSELTIALKLSPKNLSIRQALADALRANGNFAQAAAEAKLILAKAPDDALTHALLGQAEIGMGEYGQGLAELQRATELDPDDEDIRARFAEAKAKTQYQSSPAASPVK